MVDKVKKAPVITANKAGAPAKTVKKDSDIIVPVGQKTEIHKMTDEEFKKFVADVKAKAAADKKEKAEINILNDLKSGKLQCDSGSSIFGHKLTKPECNYHAGLNSYNQPETYGDLKNRYNLPDGLLREQAAAGGGGGDFDRYKLRKETVIPVSVLPMTDNVKTLLKQVAK